MDAVDRAVRAKRAAELLAGTLPKLVAPDAEASDSPEIAHVSRPELARLLARELQEMLAAHPDLAEAARRAGSEVHQNGAWSALYAGTARTLEEDGARLDTLWSLLAAAGVTAADPSPPPQSAEDAPGAVRRSSAVWGSLETGGALVLLTGVVLLPLALTGQDTEQDLLRWFAVVMMASLPGWLFLRFIVFRAGSLWTDYVLHLHRLGMDHHQYLPEPPVSSDYHRLWLAQGGPAVAGSDNIYQQKFEAYYGKAAGPRGATSGRLLRDRSIFTVLVATAIFAVGWATVLTGDAMLTGPLELPGDALRFGFMGAYSFSLQMLMRRFFQSDLKASAYIASSVRVITVLILVLVLVEAGLLGQSPGRACAAAFIVGFFPLVGMQLLQKAVAACLRRWVPTLRNPYPLSDLDGLNVWYEARLLEEGIEDMQNLVTANVVDVLLHTKVPVGRLVDWLDQAHLYLLLDPTEDDGAKNREHKDRLRLRRLGIRTATDLESAVTPPRVLARRGDVRAVTRVKDRDGANIEALRAVLGGRGPESDVAGPSAVDGLLKTFCNMPNLVHVRHWRDVLDRDHR